MNDSDDSSNQLQDCEWLGPILAASSCGCLRTTLLVMTAEAMVRSCLMAISTKLMPTGLALVGPIVNGSNTQFYMERETKRSDSHTILSFHLKQPRKKAANYVKRFSMQWKVFKTLLLPSRKRFKAKATSILLMEGVFLSMDLTNR